jgi:hypothetical protein
MLAITYGLALDLKGPPSEHKNCFPLTVQNFISPQTQSKFQLQREILLVKVDLLPFYLIRSMEIRISSVRFFSSVRHKKNYEPQSRGWR